MAEVFFRDFVAEKLVKWPNAALVVSLVMAGCLGMRTDDGTPSGTNNPNVDQFSLPDLRGPFAFLVRIQAEQSDVCKLHVARTAAIPPRNGLDYIYALDSGFPAAAYFRQATYAYGPGVDLRNWTPEQEIVWSDGTRDLEIEPGRTVLLAAFGEVAGSPGEGRPALHVEVSCSKARPKIIATSREVVATMYQELNGTAGAYITAFPRDAALSISASIDHTFLAPRVMSYITLGHIGSYAGAGIFEIRTPHMTVTYPFASYDTHAWRHEGDGGRWGISLTEFSQTTRLWGVIAGFNPMPGISNEEISWN